MISGVFGALIKTKCEAKKKTKDKKLRDVQELAQVTEWGITLSSDFFFTLTVTALWLFLGTKREN